MARRRRSRRRRPFLSILIVLVAVVVGLWWVFSDRQSPTDADATVAVTSQPALTTDRPEVAPKNHPRPGIPERGASPRTDAPARPKMSDADRVESLIKAGDQALAGNDLITARMRFSDAIVQGAVEPELSRLHAELTRIGNETVFSPRMFENDPFVTRYTIKPGDALARIAKGYKVSADLLAAVNNIANKNHIRAGQVVKVINGPFHAVVTKESLSLDVYLGNTFVKHFKVGLGADDSTPTGEWRVGTKLRDPTYYPPRGGNIIAADDPENPLGEHWIGLLGVGGEAAGQERYGIHGTIEPESIGQAKSLGCIRMYNEDVELLYMYLVEKHSTVTVRK